MKDKSNNVLNEYTNYKVKDISLVEWGIGVELDELSKEQADYIGVAVEGPYKNDEYRY